MIQRATGRVVFTLLLSLGLAGIWLPNDTRAEQSAMHQFAITEQSLSSALLAFAEQSGLEVIVDARILQGQTTAALQGQFTAQQALDKLLNNSGLRYQFVDSTTVTVLVRQSRSEPLMLESVLVTGQKIERSLQDTKESVAVVNMDIVQQRTLLSFADAALQTPNVSGTDRNGTSVTIRGVRGAVGSGAAVGGSGDVNVVFYDNVPFTGQGSRYVPQNFWDVEQIEYLRGPQSTNVGRNALAGAIVVRTVEPDPSEFDAAVRTEYGNFNTYAVSGMVNTPISESMAFRLTAEQSDTDGYISNKTIDDETGPESLNIRGRFLFEPNDRFRALASLQYLDFVNGQGEYTVFEGEDFESFVASNNDPLSFTYDGVIGSLELEYELSKRWQAVSITSFLDATYNRLTDADRTAQDTGLLRQMADENTLTQEIRFSYESERLQGAIGGFYFNFDSDDERAATFVGDLGENGPVPAPLLPFYPDIVEATALSNTDGSVSNMAFFTQWELDLSNSVQMSAGFRYDYETIDRDFSSVGIVEPGLPDPAASGQIAEMQQPGSGAFVEAGITQVNAFLLTFVPTRAEAFETDYEAFLPELGLSYALTSDTKLSAFYKRGYRSGGAQVLIDGSVNEFDPEYLDNVELALRSSLLDGALNINANAYYGNWDDQQLNVPLDGNTNNIGTINAGKSRIWGFELQGDYDLSDSTSLFAGVGYADTEFVDACRIGSTFDDLPDCEIDGAAGKDLSGNDYPFAPNWTGAIGVNHSFTEHWVAQANATYKDNQFSDVENDPRVESDGFTLLNASVGYEEKRFSVRVYGRNLADKFATNDLVLNASPGAPESLRVAPIRPRTYGIILTARY